MTNIHEMKKALDNIFGLCIEVLIFLDNRKKKPLLITNIVKVMSEKKELSEKVQLLTDPYAKSILVGCFNNPMTAQEISWEFNIPIAATYRRLRDLQEAGLVENIENNRTGKGKKASLYETSLEKAVLTFEDGKFKVNLDLGEEEIESEL